MHCETEDFVDFFLFSSLGDFSKCVLYMYAFLWMCVWMHVSAYGYAWVHEYTS